MIFIRIFGLAIMENCVAATDRRASRNPEIKYKFG